MATRVAAQPAASPHQIHRARGKRCESIAAAAKATSAWLLGSPSPPVERGRSVHGRKTYSPSCAQARSRRKTSLSSSATIPPAAADPSSSIPRRPARPARSRIRRAPSQRTSAPAAAIQSGR